MEPNRKKRKLNESSECKELEFLDLNDDCIRKILWKLSPADLCSMSFTCERMQELTFYHFPRQYSDERVTVVMDEWKRPQLLRKDTKKYLSYFSKCTPIVRIVSYGTHDNIQCLFDFVNTKCCANLRTLQLNIEGRLKPVNIDVIRSRLENLTTLSIHSPHRRYDIHDVLLKHCKKLEHLEMFSKSTFDASWMLHEYPTLKSLSIDVEAEDQVVQFKLFAKTFFQLNPQIKSLECMENNVMKAVLLNVMKAVLLNVIKIERLDLRFYCWNQFHAMTNDLIDYSKQSHIEFLRLTIAPDNTTTGDYVALQNLNAV